MRLAIVGTGLIGASLGLAARRAGAEHVAGWDVDPDALEVAAERGAVSRGRARSKPRWQRSTIAVVAVPVAALATAVRDAARVGAGRLHGHRRRLDEGVGVRGRGR